MLLLIDNTNVVRVEGATITALDGTETLVSDPGVYTLRDRDGVEVPGQVWPADLVLINAGDYAGYLEADVDIDPNMQYVLDVAIGTSETGRASWSLPITPVIRND